MARVIVLDTETTGLDPEEHTLVELAAVGVDKQNESYETLVNPYREIPPEAKAIHHITEKMCREAPTDLRATSNLLDYFERPEVVVAHNAKFDRSFMTRLFDQYDYAPKWICTYKCSQVVYPNAPSHSNQVLRYWLGAEPTLPEGLAPHRALYDVLVTREIFQSLLTQKSINELHQISSNPVLLTHWPFGKHKGELCAGTPWGYLRWITQQADMNEDVAYTARHYLARR